MLKIFRQYFWNQSVIWILLREFFFGYMMAIATFWILPLSIEYSGLLSTFLGASFGVVLFFIFHKKLSETEVVRLFLCFGIFLFFLFFRLPFLGEFPNGFYLGCMTGILLSVQIAQLSYQEKTNFSGKKSDVLYLLGLILGILLK